jgi:hypothetical protein
MMRPIPVRNVLLTACVLALALLLVMGAIQKLYQLDNFRLGANFSYSANDLQNWITAEPRKARIAVFPVLFPLDLLFLLVVGGFFALCSVTYSESAGVPPARKMFLLILPLIYMAADFGENVLLARMLTDSKLATPELVALTHAVTWAKWGSFVLAAAQTGIIYGFSGGSRG